MSAAIPRRTPNSPHRQSWEDDYGMELTPVMRYRAGRPPAQSVADGRTRMYERVTNGSTPVVPLRLHGTRLSLGGRQVVLLTLARTVGGYRMVAVDPTERSQRELWSKAKLSRNAASKRHFSAVEALCADGGIVLGGDVAPSTHRRVSLFPVGDADASVWGALAVQLEADGADQGPVGDVARVVVERLRSGDLPGVVVELFDAARVPFVPLAQRAAQWLDVIGYQRAKSLLSRGLT